VREEDEDLKVCRPWTVGLQFTLHTTQRSLSGVRTQGTGPKTWFKVRRAKARRECNCSDAATIGSEERAYPSTWTKVEMVNIEL
jgi:hypothetical protein